MSLKTSPVTTRWNSLCLVQTGLLTDLFCISSFLLRSSRVWCCYPLPVNNHSVCFASDFAVKYNNADIVDLLKINGNVRHRHSNGFLSFFLISDASLIVSALLCPLLLFEKIYFPLEPFISFYLLSLYLAHRSGRRCFPFPRTPPLVQRLPSKVPSRSPAIRSTEG